MATFGYARVSTRDQALAGQMAELQAAGCGNIFKEKASGARTDRPELAKAIRRLEPGDVLVVTRLDRLARSTRDLLNIFDAVGKAGAVVRREAVSDDLWSGLDLPVPITGGAVRGDFVGRRALSHSGLPFAAEQAGARWVYQPRRLGQSRCAPSTKGQCHWSIGHSAATAYAILSTLRPVQTILCRDRAGP
jgi:hypothetical protein